MRLRLVSASLCCFQITTLILMIGMLAACGSSSHSTSPSTPVFTSTPNTEASQGTAYSYQVSATDPAGGAVTFTLTSGPTGAALSGSTVNWTPTAAESRVANNFVVTAATSSGGSAQQSWAVTPSGTVMVNAINTAWGPGGAVQVPEVAVTALNIEALVPQKDGSIILLKASATSTPGVFTISNVPGGNYWLSVGGGAYWTNTGTFDAGRDIASGNVPLTGTENDTAFQLNVNIVPQTSPEWVEFITDPVTGELLCGLQAGATTAGCGFGAGSNIDWSQITNGFLMQYVPETVGSQNLYVLGPELSLSNLSFTDGTTNDVSGTLNAATEAPGIDLSVPGSQWASAFSGIGPAAATAENSILMLTAEPYVTGVNAAPESVLPAIVLADPLPGAFNIAIPYNPNEPILNPISEICEDSTGETASDVTVVNPPILTDENLGTLEYGDPFDSTWTRAMAFCQQATVPIAIQNSSQTYNFLIVDGESVAPSSSPLAPTALPVQSPTIGGASLYTAGTISTTMPVLSWTAPTGVSPYGYKVQVYIVTTLNGAPYLQSIGLYGTSETSMTLPPLSGGNAYVFTITAEVDGAANMQTSPFRSALPTGFASVVSAPITVSPSTAEAQVRGDIGEWRRLVSPKPRSQGQQKVRATGNGASVFEGRVQ